MFLQLAHTKLNVYGFSQALVLECYRITKTLPADERFNMVQQIRRAALSVTLNMLKVAPESQRQKEIGFSK